jgi:hypothetical protein
VFVPCDVAIGPDSQDRSQSSGLDILYDDLAASPAIAGLRERLEEWISPTYRNVVHDIRNRHDVEASNNIREFGCR